MSDPGTKWNKPIAALMSANEPKAEMCTRGLQISKVELDLTWLCPNSLQSILLMASAGVTKLISEAAGRVSAKKNEIVMQSKTFKNLAVSLVVTQDIDFNSF